MFRPIICGTKDEPGLIAPLRAGDFPVGVALPYLINNNNQCRIIHYPNAWNRLYEERIAVTDKAAWKGTYLSHHPERRTDHLFYINIYFVFLGLLIYGVIYAVQENKVSFSIGSAMKIWRINSRCRIRILQRVLLAQPFLLFLSFRKQLCRQGQQVRTMETKMQHCNLRESKLQEDLWKVLNIRRRLQRKYISHGRSEKRSVII